VDDADGSVRRCAPAARHHDREPASGPLSLHPNGTWATRRLRPNIVVDVDDEGWPEDTWCGRTVRVGTAAVQPAVRCERCTMVTRPQPGLDRDLDIFKTLARHHGATLGVWTTVQSPGVVRVGDEVTLTE
jgi:uncharacterized protein